MSKIIFSTLFVFNVLVGLINAVFHYSKIYTPNLFGVSIQLVVLFFTLSALYIYKNPSRTKWLGDKLEASSGANITISYVFSVICLLPACIFNLYPLVSKYG